MKSWERIQLGEAMSCKVRVRAKPQETHVASSNLHHQGSAIGKSRSSCASTRLVRPASFVPRPGTPTLPFPARPCVPCQKDLPALLTQLQVCRLCAHVQLPVPPESCRRASKTKVTTEYLLGTCGPSTKDKGRPGESVLHGLFLKPTLKFAGAAVVLLSEEGGRV